jgi:hypothetical protein
MKTVHDGHIGCGGETPDTVEPENLPERFPKAAGPKASSSK